jgi:hypothetical protein
MAVSVAERKQQQAAQCEETAGRFPGWHIWTTREGSPVATRTGNPVVIDDGTWAQTIIADNWDELEQRLADQTRNDAAHSTQARP